MDRPVWPSVEGEQLQMMHLDVGVADLEAGVRWAVDQGAAVADHQPQADVRVMLDPDGHPFCLFPNDRALTRPSRAPERAQACRSGTRRSALDFGCTSVRRSRGDSESEGKREPGLRDLDAEHLLLTVDTVVDPPTLGVKQHARWLSGWTRGAPDEPARLQHGHGSVDQSSTVPVPQCAGSTLMAYSSPISASGSLSAGPTSAKPTTSSSTGRHKSCGLGSRRVLQAGTPHRRSIRFGQ